MTNDADKLFQRGKGLLSKGEIGQAREIFEKVININSKHFDALHLLGIIAAQSKEFEHADHLFSEAIKVNSKNAVVYCNRGNVAKEINNLEIAVSYYDKAINLNKDYALAHLNRSIVLFELKQLDEALLSTKKALLVKPNYAEAFYNQGNILDEMNRYEEALKCFDEAINLNQNYAPAYLGRGIVLNELKRFDEALKNYEKAIQLKSDYAKAYYNRAIVLNEIKCFDEAIESYDKAIEYNYEYAESFSNRGVLLNELKRFEDALISFDRAIELKPAEASNYYNKSLLLLSQKNFSEGWTLYDWRWQDHSLGFTPLVTNKPKLNNLKLSQNKKILIWSEQGIGDQILYASMLQQLFNVAPLSTVSLDKRLIGIMKRSFPNGNFIDKEIDINQIDFDEHLPIADLGKYFRSHLTDFDNIKNQYLKVDNQRAKEIRNTLIGSDTLLCGISWYSKTRKVGIEKTIQLENLLPILKIKRIAFVSLQYGDVKDELIKLNNENNINVKECLTVDNFNDIDGHAALIAACDFVISSSNTSAHISGAIGKETYLMCPTGKGFLWYWANQVNRHSLWYPSIQIFEQNVAGQWQEIVENIKNITTNKLSNVD